MAWFPGAYALRALSWAHGSGQVRFITRPKSRTMRAKRKINVLELTERGAETGNELESDRAMGG